MRVGRKNGANKVYVIPVNDMNTGDVDGMLVFPDGSTFWFSHWPAGTLREAAAKLLRAHRAGLEIDVGALEAVDDNLADMLRREFAKKAARQAAGAEKRW